MGTTFRGFYVGNLGVACQPLASSGEEVDIEMGQNFGNVEPLLLPSFLEVSLDDKGSTMEYDHIPIHTVIPDRRDF